MLLLLGMKIKDRKTLICWKMMELNIKETWNFGKFLDYKNKKDLVLL